jgi:hypothetical protein
MSKVNHISETDAELLAFIMEFRKDHFDKPFEIGHVAAWVLRDKKWTASQRSVFRELKKELARVAKVVRHIDRQGRRVRTMHAIRVLCDLSDGKVVQKTLWDHLDTMSADHAETSFGQRHNQISRASVSLNLDKSSFNENNPNAKGREIYLSFNFDPVVDEAMSAGHEVQEIPLPTITVDDDHDGPTEPLPPS